MKHTYILLFLLVAFGGLASCSDDNDSNPKLKIPTDFVLNTPKYASGVYDLKNTETVELTCTQPDYGFTAACVYTVQVSVNADFSTYLTLGTKYNTARMEVDAKEMAVALVDLLGIDSEEDYPEDALPVYVRLQAAIDYEGSEVLSNIIELPRVKGYFALDDMTLPEKMYLIGNVTGWDWDKPTEMVPVHGNEGKFWAIQYLGKVDDGGQMVNAEIKFNYDKAWDGNQFGIPGADIPDTSVALAGISGDDNIVIGNPGWYLVVVTAVIEGRGYKFTVEFLPPNIYLMGAAAGGSYDPVSQWLFSIPTDRDGEFVSPAFAAAANEANDGIRVCVVLSGIDWWRTEFIVLDGKIAYRGAGDDQERVNGAVGQKIYLNFTAGTGRVQ